MIKAAVDECLFPLSVMFGGGDACDVATLPIDRLFRNTFEKMRGAHYLDGLSRFEIWLRVAGTLWEFNDESGPHRLATGRNPPRLMIDLVIAKRDYENVPQEEFRQFFGDQVQRCFDLMLARALKKKAVKDEAKLRADFATGMQQFRTAAIPPYVPLGTSYRI